MALRLFEVVKFEGNKDSFAWMFSNPNVKKNTTVVVGPNQYAFWVSNGQMVKVMGPGKHKVDGNYTQGFSWVVSQFHDGEVPSSGEIWFVSTGLRNIRWGTPHRLQINLNYFDTFRTTASVAANGNLQVKLSPDLGPDGEADLERIWDFVQLLREEYGDEGRSVSVQGMQRYIRDSILQVVQAHLAGALLQVNWGDHYAHLPIVAEQLQKQAIDPELEQYGMEVRNFQILLLEGDKDSQARFNKWWNTLTEADIKKYEVQRAAEAERYQLEQVGAGMGEARRSQGYTFQEERQFDVLQAGAGNKGIGGDFTSAGVGLAIGAKVGGAMGGLFETASENVATASRAGAPPTPQASADNLPGATNLGGAPTPPAPTPPAPTPPAPDAPANASGAADMKFCIHCGTKIPAHAKFCSNCGEAQ